MRFLKESLLSFFVVGIVLSLYFVAAAAALFGARSYVHKALRKTMPFQNPNRREFDLAYDVSIREDTILSAI